MHKWLLMLRSDSTHLTGQWAKCEQRSAALLSTWGFCALQWRPASHSAWTPRRSVSRQNLVTSQMAPVINIDVITNVTHQPLIQISIRAFGWGHWPRTDLGHVFWMRRCIIRTHTPNVYTYKKTRPNIYLNFMYLPLIKSINTPRAAPPLGSSFNTDRPCIWQPGFAPCSQAVCSIHLAALTIATEREKKTCLPSPPLISSEKEELSPLPPSHPSLSFNKCSSNLWSVSLSSPFSSPAHPSRSRTGGRCRPEKCEATWGKHTKLYMLPLVHNDKVVRIMNIVALL